MHGGKLGDFVSAGAAAQIHGAEHVPCALFFLLAAVLGASLLDGAGELPAVLAAAEAVGFTVVAGADNFALGDPKEVGEGEELGGDRNDGCRWLLGSGGVDHGDAAVVCGEGEGVAGR